MPVLALALSACGDNVSVDNGDAGPIELTPLSYDIEGVIVAPFTVADALAANNADHEVAGDYAYDATSATTITLDGTSVTVEGAGATSSGGTVTVSAPGTYVLAGTLTEGQVVVNSPVSGAVKLVLSGTSIASSSDSGIRVDEADRVVLILADGTTNTVTDGATYPAEAEQNAAVWSDDDLSIGGSGALIVTGRFEDGIASKDGLVIRDGTITVSAPDEGIRGKDYLVVRGGTLDVTAGGDGLKSDEDEDAALGYVLIAGGTITIDADGDGVTAETDALVSDGTLFIRSGGGAGIAPDDDVSTKGLKGGVLVVVDNGTITIDASDDGIHSNDTVVVNGGTIEIATGDDGVHGDLALTINAGDVTITRSFEGLESVTGDLVINGGTIDITATDDGLNLSGDGDDPPGVETPGDPYDMVFNGGRITVTAGNDGIDSNGSIVMTGGCLAIDGPVPGTQPEQGAIDYNGDFEIAGGVLVAAGAAGRMAQTPGTTSAQPVLAVTFSSSQSAGTLITLAGDDGATAFESGKPFQSLVVSAPWFLVGETVGLYRGGTVSGSATDGLFDGGTVSGATYLETVTLSSIVTSVTF
ncbi:carbohydrate-binding domain-containing protein [bacterium]|nr:carbohydrate-binding domain-containing protein [bacterium]